jgi:hypothetical protein
VFRQHLVLVGARRLQLSPLRRLGARLRVVYTARLHQVGRIFNYLIYVVSNLELSCIVVCKAVFSTTFIVCIMYEW